MDLALNAQPANAFQGYLIVGTLSGTAPGTPLPGGTTLPLNLDGFSTALINLTGSPFVVGFLGTVDDVGQASAQLDTISALPPAFVGLKMHFAFTTFVPFGLVSNAVEIEVVNQALRWILGRPPSAGAAMGASCRPLRRSSCWTPFYRASSSAPSLGRLLK